jgi:hypothetical protein
MKKEREIEKEEKKKEGSVLLHWHGTEQDLP